MSSIIQYFRNIKDAVITTGIGFGVTFRHLFTRSVTLQYPTERWELPERSRMQLYMDWDDCIGCFKCARACPVDCIHITTTKVPRDFDLGETSGGTPKRLLVEQFDIDMSECMYCALCVYPCPEDCIYMIGEYEFSVYDRGDLIYDFAPVPEDLRQKAYAAIEEEKKAKARAREKKRREASRQETSESEHQDSEGD
ncbi:MAG TPA: NADH-quinone oxidoreductase subunit I [bacterium]|nr:NADH-quinone oxidoreductase subunit I [bacterium]